MRSAGPLPPRPMAKALGHRRRPRRADPFADARGGADPRPYRRRHERDAGRNGSLAHALFRDSLSRRRRRHPGHRQPQPGRLQRLQIAAQRPLGVRRGDPGDRRARRRRAIGPRARAASRKSTSARLMPTGCCRTFPATPIRIGWDAGNGAAGPVLDMLVERLPGEHHVIFAEVDGTFPNHHPDPTVEANLADLEAARRGQAARLRHRLRRRRRPHRRGRRPGPGDLGRPADADPRRAGAQGASRRDDHRRRQGEPGAVRRHRRARRHSR